MLDIAGCSQRQDRKWLLVMVAILISAMRLFMRMDTSVRASSAIRH